ncbi:PREDICTED: mitogen-activated protein kinase kinase kinase YODA-like [Populus euphratica]|uniref:mitogen-activated protein kinase kinase kinase n=1 Tax=Populus euphratica TaxID=75702 RepID=A0AAJ6U5D6_POPEU|nr:PREDICTED: mitogen-activated protein kinase kinase kinase YODA-like [Populus euphratica]
MPAWWSKRSSKSKEGSNQENSHGKNYKKICSITENKRKSSLDEAALRKNSPRGSKEFAGSGGSSGFSGLDSDSGGKRGLPLPEPCVSDLGAGSGIAGAAGGFGFGPGSGSVSSVSSSGSSGVEDHDNNQGSSSLFGGYRLSVDHRGHGGGSRSPVPGSRSPVPGSRTTSRPTSPLHPLLGGMSLDSSTGRLEDGKSQWHPLPLPPGSPTSPPSIPGTRTTGATDNSTLSKWKKGKLLGRGTFGHVYLGFNSRSGQMCAIKEVKVISDDSTSKECLKQLKQEIDLLSQLSHSNIVRYYGSELSEETLSVYLEYVSGGSIHKLLQEYGAFTEPVIQNYTRQILSGLAYLHGRNTVHRDIKGANILVDPNGEIKLVDFGMAKHIMTCSSMLSFKGSPYWMAPEVVMNTNGYSLAVDIWSLGCTILEMATSKPPWSQYEGVAAIFKIGNSKDMPDIPDYISNDAKSFIKLCLQRDPLARPTASQLLDHPFIRDQSTTRVVNINITRDAFPRTFDGSRTPPALELHSNRTNANSCDGDFAMKPVVNNIRALKNPRDDGRMITSMPVSPCSSPLRQHGPAHRSSYLSPPHPAFAMMGQSSYNLSDFSLYPIRQGPYTHDLFFDTPPLKFQTPGTSPRTRPI